MRFAFLLALLPGTLAPAEVTLPKIIADHMVVQREMPVHVWGMAAPGEEVSVSFRGETRSSKTGRLGRWSVYLPTGEAGGPFQMTVRGPAAQNIILDDVLVGDVWVASGQSNMEFEMHKAATAAEDLPHAANPHIRLLMVKRNAAEYAQDDIATDGWAASSPEVAKDFSAVAWYFAREIEQREHVPVGIIDSTWGGTPGEAWVSMTALGQDGSLNPLFASWGKMTDHETTALISQADEQRQRDEAKAQAKPMPVFPWHPRLESWGPGMLYNGMIAPLT